MQGLKGFLSFLTAPMIGALSDVWGRRVFLLVTVGATCLPLAFLLFSNLWWHVVASVLSGPFAVTFSIVFAYVSDVTDEHTRSAAFGQVSATFAGSMVISPAVGSFIYTVYGRNAVFATSCVVATLDVIYILAVVPESLSAENMARRVVDWKTVRFWVCSAPPLSETASPTSCFGIGVRTIYGICRLLTSRM
jgi:MFS family permease